MRQTIRAIWCATFACTLLAAPSAMAQHSDNAQTTCSASECQVGLSFSAAVRLERVACMFDMRAPTGKTPKLVRAILRRVNTFGTALARQDLPFTNTYDGGARQIFMVATNPLFNVSSTETAVVVALATNDTTSIKVDCYAAGFAD